MILEIKGSKNDFFKLNQELLLCGYTIECLYYKSAKGTVQVKLLLK